MKKRLIIPPFIVGLLAMIAWIAGNVLWTLNVAWIKNREAFLPLLSFFITAAAAAFLIILGIVFQERARWLAFTYAAVLLIGFSIGWLYSLGFFLLPLGLFILAKSLFKLRQYRILKQPTQAPGV